MKLSNHLLLKHRVLRVSVLICLALLTACGERAPKIEPAGETDLIAKQDKSANSGPEFGPLGEVPDQVWWKDGSNIEVLGLNPEQLEHIKAIDSRYFGERVQLRRQERRAYTRFIGALRANNPGGEQIEKSSEAFLDCRASRQELLVWRLTELRQVLTLEQWTELKNVAPAVMQIGVFQPVGSSEPVFISAEEPVGATPPGE